MRTHQSRRGYAARTARMIGLAAMAGLGLHHLTPDDTVAGGGGGDKSKDDKKTADADKIQMTAEERAKLIADAKAEAKREAEEARNKEREEVEKAELEKKGEVQKLLDKEKTDRVAADERAAVLELKLKRADVKDQLRKHLDEKHKDYAGSLDDIFLHLDVQPDTKDDEIAKRIKAATDGFVARNPRGRVAPPPPPAGPRGDHKADSKPDNDEQRLTFTGAAARF